MNFTSEKICCVCHCPFQAKDVRKERLCKICKSKEETIKRIAGDRSIADLTDDDFVRITQDKTTRRGPFFKPA